MNEPKPIITIKQKCSNKFCEDGDIWDMLDKKDKTYIQCPVCSGTGTQTK